MADNDLTASETEPTSTDTLDATIGGSIPRRLKLAVVEAFRGYGWDQSAGVRTVVVAFLESAQVRDAVIQHIHTRVAA